MFKLQIDIEAGIQEDRLDEQLVLMVNRTYSKTVLEVVSKDADCVVWHDKVIRFEWLLDSEPTCQQVLSTVFHFLHTWKMAESFSFSITHAMAGKIKIPHDIKQLEVLLPAITMNAGLVQGKIQ